MRWLSFCKDGYHSFGYLLPEDGVVDVGSRTSYPDLRAAIADNGLDSFRGASIEPDFYLDQISYLPPITNPEKILCVGLNYKAHQEETGRGGEAFPTIFTRFASAQVAHMEPMICPIESPTLDFEGEIALVIGQKARRVKGADALDSIAGFSIYNDGSVREYQRHTSQFTAGKNFIGTGAFGPWFVTPDEVPDLSSFEITTRLNGQVMQNATSDLMIFSFGEIIEYCSTFVELSPGDIIVTGTPGGVGVARTPPIFMKAGDLIEVQIDPIGVLKNVIAEG